MTTLTRDADKLLCAIYKSYLEKRKSGMDKIKSRYFEIVEIQNFKICSSWSLSDIKATVAEISRSGLGDMYYNGSFYANDQFIIYMENRFKNGLNDVIDTISKFIP